MCFVADGEKDVESLFMSNTVSLTAPKLQTTIL